MTSSTSSSSASRTSRRHHFLAVVLLAPFVVAMVGLLRAPSTRSGLPPDLFWVEKVKTEQRFDLVLVGDSRIYRGLSPDKMNETLRNIRILNFGFMSAPLIETYLSAAQEMLDPESLEPVIVLGVTPHALTRSASKKNNFYSYAAHTPFLVFLRRVLTPGWHFLRAFDHSELWRALSGGEGGYFEVFHPDGWVASRRVPEDPTIAIDVYREQFAAGGVVRSYVTGLIAIVSRWTRAGIRVYGFRPPSTPAMVELENEMSGFDEEGFVRAFEEQGGTWLRFPEGVYPSYDGSHLREDGALALSADLAAELGRRLR